MRWPQWLQRQRLPRSDAAGGLTWHRAIQGQLFAEARQLISIVEVDRMANSPSDHCRRSEWMLTLIPMAVIVAVLYVVKGVLRRLMPALLLGFESDGRR